VTVGDLSGCIIVAGMPGAGNPTVTSVAARMLPRAARIVHRGSRRAGTATRCTTPWTRATVPGYAPGGVYAA